MKILFVSLGCDKNLVDSEEMLGALRNAGYSFTDDEDEADIAVVNTCCFIMDAQKESIDQILALAERRTAGQLKALIAQKKFSVDERLDMLMYPDRERFYLNKALGLKNTHFENPHGLDAEDHRTTAEDLALLACAALENPVFEKIVGTKRIIIGENENARTLVNHNRLLFSLDGCIGVKTGYTMRAGRCLVSACRREDTTLVCVTLHCRDDWDAHRALYDYGFARVRRHTWNERELALPLIGGVGQTVALRVPSSSLLCEPDDRLETRLVCPHFLFAPLRRGDKVGELIVLLNGKRVLRLDVLCAEDAEEAERPGFFARLIDKIFK